MLIVISPAKSLDLNPIEQSQFSMPSLRTDANKLAKILKQYDSQELQSMMSISENLADENVKRYKSYRPRTAPNAKRAVNTFMGDVYRGLDVSDFSGADYQFAQDHLRILSGLYGLLRPLDLIQPYRLEMGTQLATDKGKNLYEYWGNKITNEINKSLKAADSDLLVNLASEEYFKSVNKKKVKADILTLNFKEYRGDALKFISFSAKVARGLMSRYIIKNRLKSKEDIKGFAVEGYAYSQEHSTEDSWIFVR